MITSASRDRAGHAGGLGMRQLKQQSRHLDCFMLRPGSLGTVCQVPVLLCPAHIAHALPAAVLPAGSTASGKRPAAQAGLQPLNAPSLDRDTGAADAACATVLRYLRAGWPAPADKNRRGAEALPARRRAPLPGAPQQRSAWPARPLTCRFCCCCTLADPQGGRPQAALLGCSKAGWGWRGGRGVSSVANALSSRAAPPTDNTPT